MKKKAIAGILVTLTLLAALVFVIPVQAQPTIKIGIIGPNELPHWSPAGMKEGAELARDEINVAGVNVGGTVYDFELLFADEHSAPPHDPAAAQAEIVGLVGAGAQVIVGGFRTECTYPMIEKAMDLEIPFIIDGAATSWLVENVTTDYARYKYLFRVTPVNDSMLLPTITDYLKNYLVPERLLPMCGHDLGKGVEQVRAAVLMEDLDWTLLMYGALTTPAVYPMFLGPNVNVTYAARIPVTTTDFTSYFNTIKSQNVHLIIHIFSGALGVPYAIQWKSQAVPAVTIGINVMAQLQIHWSNTGGACEGEGILSSTGTRTEIVDPLSTDFWDAFITKTGGVWPIYTAWGAYNSLKILAEAYEAAGSLDKDALVTALEGLDTVGTLGKFKFTSNHDVYCASTGAYAAGYEYSRAFLVQWQTPGVMEVVSPVDAMYSRRFKIPTALYEFADADLNFDGTVDIFDALFLAGVFGSGPKADPPDMAKWDVSTDIVVDGVIDIFDALTLAGLFGGTAPVWPIP